MRKTTKRLLSLGLAMLMVVSSSHMSTKQVSAKSQQVPTPKVSYDMTLADGKLIDATGNGVDANVVGFTSSDVSETEAKEKVLAFTGDKSKYVELPSEMISDDNFTIDIKLATSIHSDAWVYGLGTKVENWPNVNNYAFLAPMKWDGKLNFAVKDDGTEGEKKFQKGSIASGEVSYVTMSFSDDKTVSVYADGKLVEVLDHGYNLYDILVKGSEETPGIIGYIGRSLYEPDPAFNGSIYHFDVYDSALSAEEVAAIVEADQEKWGSDEDEDIIVDYTDEEKVSFDTETLTIQNVENIKTNITLPIVGERGSVITWESSNKEVITDQAQILESYDDIPAGVVTRQNEDVEVTLTATITSNAVVDTKVFTATVKAKAEDIDPNEYGGYLMTHFTGETEFGEQIYFATSEDAKNWTDLNDSERVLESKLGEQGVRDPYILRTPEGDHFYMIATDLRIASGKGWGEDRKSVV